MQSFSMISFHLAYLRKCGIHMKMKTGFSIGKSGQSNSAVVVVVVFTFSLHQKLGYCKLRREIV